ncbi:hypothetical protein NL676_003021 [Syzygium grande]|nr:hypothetical protein NL676_003021 [Syzygium grande]
MAVVAHSRAHRHLLPPAPPPPACVIYQRMRLAGAAPNGARHPRACVAFRFVRLIGGVLPLARALRRTLSWRRKHWCRWRQPGHCKVLSLPACVVGMSPVRSPAAMQKAISAPS